MRLTLARAKKAGTPISLCADSPKLLAYINEACEILHDLGDYPGKRFRYRVPVQRDCQGNRCVTWPRQIETIEGAAFVKGQNIGIRGIWFEFDDNGTGLADCVRAPLLYDRSTEACLLSDIDGNNKKLKVVAERVEKDSASLTFFGYDPNRVWIRTEVTSGVWIDGEPVDIINGNPQTTINNFSSVVQVQKSMTNGPVQIIEVDDDSGAQRLVAYYEYDEVEPIYRRQYLTAQQCGNCDTLDVLAIRRVLTVSADTDLVYPPIFPALQAMVVGLHKRDNGDWNAYEAARQQARVLLLNRSENSKGHGVLRQMRFQNGQVWGVGFNIQ